MSDQGSAVSAEGKEAEVRRFLGGFEGALTDLHGGLSALEDRLKVVLREEPPSEVATLTEEVLVPLASELRDHLNGIRGATRTIHSLLERLEL